MKIRLGVMRERFLDMADVSEVTVSDLDDNHVRASLVGIVAALQDAHTRLERASGHSITCAEYECTPMKHGETPLSIRTNCRATTTKGDSSLIPEP